MSDEATKKKELRTIRTMAEMLVKRITRFEERFPGTVSTAPSKSENGLSAKHLKMIGTRRKNTIKNKVA
jgi:hypothetical protein